MILEAAMLEVKPDLLPEFEQDFKEAGQYISAIPGYLEHTLHHCLEKENKYLLLVKWEKLEDHTIGFRQSSEYLEWKRILHHYYDPFPVVEHFNQVI
ncbi:MAG: antibiotic biosynthesis monooxygenase [Cyclobacteriaceae bacterium]